MLLRGQIEKRMILENLDYLLLSIDEIVDGGYVLREPRAGAGVRLTQPANKRRVVLEADASIITSRVSLRGAENDLPLSEQVRVLYHRQILLLHWLRNSPHPWMRRPSRKRSKQHAIKSRVLCCSSVSVRVLQGPPQKPLLSSMCNELEQPQLDHEQRSPIITVYAIGNQTF